MAQTDDDLLHDAETVFLQLKNQIHDGETVRKAMRKGDAILVQFARDGSGQVVNVEYRAL